MHRTIFLLSVALAFLLNACGLLDYEPKGSYHVDVPHPPPKQIYFNIENVTKGDTLILWDTATFYYDAEYEGHAFSEIRPYLDGKAFSYSVTSYSFSFDTRHFEDGPHTLTIVFWVRTESGSLADRLGLEGYVVKKEIPVYIDNRIFEGDIILNDIQFVDGLPALSWTPYPYKNFQKGALLRELSNNGKIQIDTVATWRRPATSYWIDSTFIGGAAEYYVSIRARDRSYQSDKQGINIPLPAFSDIAIVDSGALEIRWVEPAQPIPNFNAYLIMKGIQKFYNKTSWIAWQDSFVIRDISQTSFIDRQPVFGQPLVYRLVLQTAAGKIIASQKTYKYGKPFPSIISAQYVPGRDQFCLLGYDENHHTTNLFFDEESETYTVFPDYFIAFSPDGQMAFKIAKGETRGIVYRVNPSQPDEILDHFQLRTPDGAAEQFWKFSVTNNGYLAFEDQGDNNVAYDALHKWRIYYKSSKEVGHLNQIAPNGKYAFFSDGWMYRIAINKFQKLYSIPEADHAKVTFMEDPEFILFTSNQAITICNTIDKSEVRRFPIERDLYHPVIDPVSHHLGGFTRGEQYYRIYDLETGALVKEIPIAFQENSIGSTLFYWAKNTLFSRQPNVGTAYMKIFW